MLRNVEERKEGLGRSLGVPTYELLEDILGPPEVPGAGAVADCNGCSDDSDGWYLTVELEALEPSELIETLRECLCGGGGRECSWALAASAAKTSLVTSRWSRSSLVLVCGVLEWDMMGMLFTPV